MSTIKKTPEIEVIIGRLTESQLTTLRTAVNSSSFETFKSLIELPVLSANNTTDIACYQLQFDLNHIYNGIAIRIFKDNKAYENFIVYDNSQKLTIYELNGTDYKLINEYCDINELRRIIEEKRETSGDTWVEAMKTHIVEDGEGVKIDSVFAESEIEFYDNSGDFGTNAKAKINALSGAKLYKHSLQINNKDAILISLNSEEYDMADDIIDSIGDNEVLLIRVKESSYNWCDVIYTVDKVNHACNFYYYKIGSTGLETLQLTSTTSIGTDTVVKL